MPRLYNRSYGSNALGSISEAGNHLIYSFQPSLTVTPNNHTKVYGANDPTQTYATSAFVTDDGVTDTATTAGLTSFSRVAGESVGTRAITQGGFTSNAGYGITFVTGNTLTITQAALTASIANQNKVYGADDPSLPGLSLSGQVNRTVVDWMSNNTVINDTAGAKVADTLASLTRGAGEAVAAYNITGSSFNALTGTSAGNYSAPVALTGTPTLNITPRNISVTADAQAKTYGGTDPSLTYAVGGSGLANNPGIGVIDTQATVFAGAQTRAAGETVASGPYAISQGTLAANSNYNVTGYTGSNLTIGAAPLNVIADNKSRPVATPNPPFTATYSGFVLGETPASLGSTLQFNTPATPVSPQGLYSITPFGLASSNYNITYVLGVLTVGAPAPTTPPTTPPLTTLNNLLSANFYAFAYSTLNPYASAVGGTGSIVMTSGADDFLNTQPRTAAGSETGIEPAAVGDTGTNGFQPIRDVPSKAQRNDANCFSSQPLTALKCR